MSTYTYLTSNAYLITKKNATRAQPGRAAAAAERLFNARACAAAGESLEQRVRHLRKRQRTQRLDQLHFYLKVTGRLAASPGEKANDAPSFEDRAATARAPPSTPPRPTARCAGPSMRRGDHSARQPVFADEEEDDATARRRKRLRLGRRLTSRYRLILLRTRRCLRVGETGTQTSDDGAWVWKAINCRPVLSRE